MKVIITISIIWFLSNQYLFAQDQDFIQYGSSEALLLFELGMQSYKSKDFIQAKNYLTEYLNSDSENLLTNSTFRQQVEEIIEDCESRISSRRSGREISGASPRYRSKRRMLRHTFGRKNMKRMRKARRSR